MDKSTVALNKKAGANIHQQHNVNIEQRAVFLKRDVGTSRNKPYLFLATNEVMTYKAPISYGNRVSCMKTGCRNKPAPIDYYRWSASPVLDMHLHMQL